MFWYPGVLIGRFYNEAGEPTEALLRVEASLAEGKKLKAQSEAERIRFPSCNSEWTAASGGRFWCSTKRYGHSLCLIENKSMLYYPTDV